MSDSGTVLDDSAVLLLTRHDGQGNLLWSRTLDITPAMSGPTSLNTSALAVSPTGDVFVALRLRIEGTLHLGAAPSRGDHFLAKLSADGTPLWVHTEEAEVLAADGEGGVVAVTRTGRVSRYDAQGRSRWAWGSGLEPVFFTTVAVDAAGGVVAAGQLSTGLSHELGFILALSSTGTERWRTTTAEKPGWSTFTDLALLPDGGVLLTGTFSRSFNWGNYRVNPSCDGRPCTLALPGPQYSLHLQRHLPARCRLPEGRHPRARRHVQRPAHLPRHGPLHRGPGGRLPPAPVSLTDTSVPRRLRPPPPHPCATARCARRACTMGRCEEAP